MQKMSFADKDLLEQREAEEDELYAVFFGHKDIQPMVSKVCNHLKSINLPPRYQNIVDKVLEKHDRMPKLAIILFGIWLCPELKLGENAQPRRFEPFEAKIQEICMKILKGEMLSLQDFVCNTLTDYIVTPKA